MPSRLNRAPHHPSADTIALLETHAGSSAG